MTSSDPDDIKDIVDQMCRLEPDSPEFDAISEKLLNLELPASPPEIFNAVQKPKLSLEQFKTIVSSKLSQCFEGRNLLHATARSGQLDRVRWLVGQGLDPHQVDDNGYSVLLNAIFSSSQSKLEVIDYLLSLGCDPDRTSKYGESPLTVSLCHGDYPQALHLIEKGANADLIGLTPLHQAAANGDLHAIEKLATPDLLEARDRWKRTPWLTAIAANQVDAVLLLEKLGADPSTQGHLNTTPLELCALHNATDSAKHLLSGLPNQKQEASFLNRQNDHGSTVLHESVAWNRLEITRFFLERGASINIANSSGEQAINNARSLPMFQLLHQFGADLNHVDGCGEWPLKSACEDDDLASVQWLLRQGAKVDQTSTGETALHTAARWASLAIIESLIQAGANVNAQDVDGDSVLFCCQSVETAKLLIKAGADPSIRNQIGETPARASYVQQEVQNYLRALLKK